MKKTILFAVVLAIVAGAFATGSEYGRRAALKTLRPQVDTFLVRDTITAEKPVFVSQRVVDSVRVPVYIPQYLHDTVTVYLPRTERVYEDSTYRAVVSGYEPSLDEISVYPQNSLIVRTVPVEVRRPSRWGAGVQAGLGVFGSGGSLGVSPYIGVGVSYNILSW